MLFKHKFSIKAEFLWEDTNLHGSPTGKTLHNTCLDNQSHNSLEVFKLLSELYDSQCYRIPNKYIRSAITQSYLWQNYLWLQVNFIHHIIAGQGKNKYSIHDKKCPWYVKTQIKSDKMNESESNSFPTLTCPLRRMSSQLRMLAVLCGKPSPFSKGWVPW